MIIPCSNRISHNTSNFIDSSLVGAIVHLIDSSVIGTVACLIDSEAIIDHPSQFEVIITHNGNRITYRSLTVRIAVTVFKYQVRTFSYNVRICVYKILGVYCLPLQVVVILPASLHTPPVKQLSLAEPWSR